MNSPQTLKEELLEPRREKRDHAHNDEDRNDDPDSI